MQFGHAIGAGPLEPHDYYDVAIEFTLGEGFVDRMLRIENATGRFDRPAFALHGRRFEACPSEIPLDQPHAAILLKRIGSGAQHLGIARGARIAPYQRIAVHSGFARIGFEAAVPYGQDIGMRQPFLEQRADDETHAARFVEVVHIARTVRVDAGDQRHRTRQFGQVCPVEAYTRCARHGGDVDCMVGGTTRGEQPDRCVDDRLFVHHPRQRTEIVGRLADRSQTVRCRPAQFLAQLGSRLDECGPGDVQPHHFHHHLVGIGGAVKGAGAGRVIASHLARQQFLAVCLALRIELANPLLLLVGDARAHRSRGHEDRGQVTEAQRTHQQSGDDLVAYSQQRHAVIHRMAERDDGRHGNRIAAEERELHARLALRNPVAHGRGPASDLQRRADLARPDLHPFGISVIGLMRGQHVVICGDHAEVRALGGHYRCLILLRTGEGMREVGT